MADNHEEIKDKDPELAKVHKSMGDRMDPDEPPTPPEPTPPAPPKDPEKKDIIPEKKDEAVPPKKEEEPPKDPVIDPEDDPTKKVKRPNVYIPLKKFHDEKRIWEKNAKTAEERAQKAEARIVELEQISNQNDGAKKDEDIEAFMAESGFERSTVEGLLKLAEKRLLKPEQIKAIEIAASTVAESEIEAAFTQEFVKVGEPDLKKRFTNAKPEQIAKAKEFLDKVAHTDEFHDKPLDFVIYKNLEEIEKFFTDETAEKKDEPLLNKKTVEASRLGNGKMSTLTAKDFEEKNDFSALNEMDQAERSALIKSFPTKTYENFKVWVSAQDANKGVEVMRDGKKVMLK